MAYYEAIHIIHRKNYLSTYQSQLILQNAIVVLCEHTPTCRSGGFLIQREPPFVETEGLTLSPQA